MVTINLSVAGAKEAVTRLREFLAADGIGLKQTHGYEALARTLGYANWNTLQSLLNAAALPENQASPAAAAPADQQTARTDEELRAEIARAVEAWQQRTVEKGGKPTLSGNLEKSLHKAIGIAAERHHEYAALEHLLLSLTEDHDAASVLRACHVDMEQLRKELTEFIDSKLDPLVATVPGDPKPTTAFQRVVQRAVLHVHASGRGYEVTGANVVVALFTERESRAVYFLQQQGMTRLDAVNFVSGGTPMRPGPDQS